ncbi:transposase [Candidatus Fermentibacterales bacterium]|nr:transposase [Candidatus Fermentibacterales bacterium]
MPRDARLDCEGALHHVMARGIGVERVFIDARDRETFLERLEHMVGSTSSCVYAWALMDNHVHLLFRTGSVPIGRSLASVLGGHATWFNRRHERRGHLFQNRFKSILVDEETYLLNLVRYIHLNPVRAGMVTLEQLCRYPWTGHSGLMGSFASTWQDSGSVLARFGSAVGAARKRLLDFMSSTDAQADVDLVEGGGLVWRNGEWVQPKKLPGKRSDWPTGQRVLGADCFASRIRDEVKLCGKLEPVRQLIKPERTETLEQLADRIMRKQRIDFSSLRAGARTRKHSIARCAICHEAVSRLGLTLAEIAEFLAISVAAASQAVRRWPLLLESNPWLQEIVDAEQARG